LKHPGVGERREVRSEQRFARVGIGAWPYDCSGEDLFAIAAQQGEVRRRDCD
jgi:hypothetical protein